MSNLIHVVDTNDLRLPDDVKDWKVIEHLRQGLRTLDQRKLGLHREPEQAGNSYIGGHEMRKRLTGKPQYLGLCELLYLQAHPELIPSSWKEVYGVYAWNTILEDSRGRLRVPVLRRRDWAWPLRFYLLGNVWLTLGPAGALEST
jgi:hypothetical protein